MFLILVCDVKNKVASQVKGVKQELIGNQGSTISVHRNHNYLSIQHGAKSNKMLSNKKVSASHTFYFLGLRISNDIVSTKIYDKRVDFYLKLSFYHFKMVMFRSTSYVVYISQLIPFA